ncbi:MAG: hypothetical protein RLZZ450_1878 [Pseudomonadota bacterium]|jgi:hypothetical protein
MFSWWRKPIPAKAPLVDYWIQASVNLDLPIAERGGRVLVSYLRIFGVRATPDSMRTMVAGCVNDGTVSWDNSEVRLVEVDRLSRKVAKPLRWSLGAGIWHKSGCIFFPAEQGTPGEEPELRRFRPYLPRQ